MKRILLFLILSLAGNCQETSIIDWMRESKIVPDRWLPQSTIIDSLRLNIETEQDSVEVIINTKLRGITPISSELINYQNHFRLDIEAPGYLPYQFIIDKPFAEYQIKCSLVSQQQGLIMRETLNSSLFENIRVQTLFVGLAAMVGAAVYEGLIDREWDSYTFMVENGFSPSKENVERYSKRARQIAYTLPIFAAIPLVTNHTQDRKVGFTSGERFQYESLSNSIRQKNAVYNYSLSFFGVGVLSTIKQNSKSRENSILWERDFQDENIHQSIEFSSNVLLTYGVVEFINWGLLRFNKPIITDYITIELL